MKTTSEWPSGTQTPRFQHATQGQYVNAVLKILFFVTKHMSGIKSDKCIAKLKTSRKKSHAHQ